MKENSPANDTLSQSESELSALKRQVNKQQALINKQSISASLSNHAKHSRSLSFGIGAIGATIAYAFTSSISSFLVTTVAIRKLAEYGMQAWYRHLGRNATLLGYYDSLFYAKLKHKYTQELKSLKKQFSQTEPEDMRLLDKLDLLVKSVSDVSFNRNSGAQPHCSKVQMLLWEIVQLKKLAETSDQNEIKRITNRIKQDENTIINKVGSKYRL